MMEHSVTLIPSGETRTFAAGTSLLDALMDMGVMLKTPCGGKGTCGKCDVKLEGAVSDQDGRIVPGQRGKPRSRLACQTRLAGEVNVFVDEIETIRKKTYPSIDPSAIYGIAVDIGTTTVRISLVDCTGGGCLEIDTFLNPQRRFGHDVISRIAAAEDPGVSRRQSHLIRKAVFSEISDAAEAMSLPGGRIEKLILSGNTTMLYLFFGLDVSPLGRSPYEAATRDFQGFSPADVGAEKAGSLQIRALPAHSAFLGADLVGGLALCHRMGLSRGVFFADLGTNGEMFIVDPAGEIYATSCAMGPALEGMNISWGMTADTGAITRITSEQGTLHYCMIGGGPPAGITGTALIDILAIMLEMNVIKDDGAFAPDLEDMHLPSPMACSFSENMLQVNLWGDITITQRDIRNFQLAKGASLAAARLLLEEADCPPEHIEQVVIAGAFGEHLDINNFQRLGFLPQFPAATYRFLGNTSLKAAQEACCDRHFFTEAAALRDSIREVSLSNHPEFATQFVKAMNFL